MSETSPVVDVADLLEGIRLTLKLQRADARITQASVAEALGVHHTQISAMEKGRTGITLATLLRWCTALVLEVRLTNPGEERMSELSKAQFALLVDAWPHLSEFQRGVLHGQAMAFMSQED